MELPTAVDLKVGETYTLRLPGLGTAGYLWTYEVAGNGGSVEVAAVTDVNSELEAGDRTASVGSSRDELFTIRAEEAGHSTIRFSQRRSWERDQPPVNQHVLEVDVTN